MDENRYKLAQIFSRENGNGSFPLKIQEMIKNFSFNKRGHMCDPRSLDDGNGRVQNKGQKVDGFNMAIL